MQDCSIELKNFLKSIKIKKKDDLSSFFCYTIYGDYLWDYLVKLKTCLSVQKKYLR